GWDGETPWLAYEVRRAFALRKPVLVLMADGSWPQREEEPRHRALMADFRAELSPVAVAIEAEEEGGSSSFRFRLFSELSRFRSEGGFSRQKPRSAQPALTLRSWPAPLYPPEPWPLLLPYGHPDLLAGRERDLQELEARLSRRQILLGLHAVSGVGKSSLLMAGLVPRLRADGRPVAYDAHPEEPGLADRLIGDLLTGSEVPSGLDARLFEEGAPEAFVELLQTAARAAGRPPVLVLDQVEQVLRGERQGRARLGVLLAATVQRRPGSDEAPCRWLLAYRRESHGEMVRWLGDALREARALGSSAAALRMPHDLANSERFHAWPLAALGASRVEGPGLDLDLEDAAARDFRAVLEKPLSLQDGEGRQRYPWRFESDGAERLASAFAAAREVDRVTPLVPELQVVLAHLMSAAGHPESAENPAVLKVPDDVAGLIDSALVKHVGRALEAAFPATGDPARDRIDRTRALLVLHQLADVQGSRASVLRSAEPRAAEGIRGAARGGDELIRTIGHRGREVLEALQAPGIRLVVAEASPGGETLYRLSHDRLAGVVIAAVHGQGGLAVDRDLLTLAHLVTLRTELHRSGERETSTALAAESLAAIEKHADCLLVDEDSRAWWSACRERRRRTVRGRWLLSGTLLALVALAAWLMSSYFAAQAAREALLDLIARGEQEAALEALGAALEDGAISDGQILERLGERASPLDVLESGLGGVAPPRRGLLVLEIAELVTPWLHAERPEDAVASASLLWALDYGPGRASDPELAERAEGLRAALLAPLRERRPPPPLGEGGIAGWRSVPCGTYLRGTPASVGGENDERPVHEVTVGSFRMLNHEITNAEFRLLDPGHEGDDDLPAVSVSWHRAMLYSAWLGGRLPSEAEWEYAARAGCAYAHCRSDGSEATVAEIAWTQATTREVGRPGTRPGGQLAANPRGLYDMFGNVWEWTSDWYGPYEASPQLDPRGPTTGSSRVARSGSFDIPPSAIRPGLRYGYDPRSESPVRGFRPIVPVESPAAENTP
ncbi:MAG: SUMF1/EgtB/PvdO family nonheme iron enzyme, partial [Acidobacteriota bacterium]